MAHDRNVDLRRSVAGRIAVDHPVWSRAQASPRGEVGGSPPLAVKTAVTRSTSRPAVDPPAGDA
jgi:hypothetical protein